MPRAFQMMEPMADAAFAAGCGGRRPAQVLGDITNVMGHQSAKGALEFGHVPPMPGFPADVACEQYGIERLQLQKETYARSCQQSHPGCVSALPVAAPPPPLAIPPLTRGTSGCGAEDCCKCAACGGHLLGARVLQDGRLLHYQCCDTLRPWQEVPLSSVVDLAIAYFDDAQDVAQYAHEICTLYAQREIACMPLPDYMDRQTSINWRMRAILVDWMVDVQVRYGLKAQTLFLAVNIIDRYLGHVQVPRTQLQLVGVTAMMVAAKFEEITPPEVQEFVLIADNAFTKDELLAREISMLTTVGFDLCGPTAPHFKEVYQRLNGCSETHQHLLQYILELTLVDHKMIRYKPSHLAAAAVLLSNKMLRISPSWPVALARHTRYEHGHVRECARELCHMYEASEHEKLQAVRRKFSSPAFNAVAKLIF